MALYNELLTSLLNSHSWLYRNSLRIIDLIMDRQSYSDVGTKGPCLDAMFLNYLRSIGMQKQMTVIGERLFDWIVSNLISLDNKHQFTWQCVSNMKYFTFSCSLEASFFGNPFTSFHFFVREVSWRWNYSCNWRRMNVTNRWRERNICKI